MVATSGGGSSERADVQTLKRAIARSFEHDPMGFQKRIEANAALDSLAAALRAGDSREEWLTAQLDKQTANAGKLLAALRAAEEALENVRERIAPDGGMCWCPDWKVDEWTGYSLADWTDEEVQQALHHSVCLAARAALAAASTEGAE